MDSGSTSYDRCGCRGGPGHVRIAANIARLPELPGKGERQQG
jgi:hypothetical protein